MTPAKTYSRLTGDSGRTAGRTILRIFGSVLMAAMLLIAISALSRPADAQEVCLVRADAIAQLEKRHGEHVIGRGLAQEGQAMVEVLASEDGTWTILVTRTDGFTCVISSGEAWTTIPLLIGDPT